MLWTLASGTRKRWIKLGYDHSEFRIGTANDNTGLKKN